RAQHPGDVAQRRALSPPLGDRPRRLALEVDDEPVTAGPEHLAEVVVTVVTDDLPDRAELREPAQPLADLLAAAEDRCQRLVVLGQLGEDVLDLVVDRRREQAQRLRTRLLRAE